MWESLGAGQGVLIECPSRWYAGVVLKKTALTVILQPDCCFCVHDTGDFGMFLDGRRSSSTETTPLRGIEINLNSIDSVHPMKLDALEVLCKRSHPES
jgi:hypothetical protein